MLLLCVRGPLRFLTILLLLSHVQVSYPAKRFFANAIGDKFSALAGFFHGIGGKPQHHGGGGSGGCGSHGGCGGGSTTVVVVKPSNSGCGSHGCGGSSYTSSSSSSNSFSSGCGSSYGCGSQHTSSSNTYSSSSSYPNCRCDNLYNSHGQGNCNIGARSHTKDRWCYVSTKVNGRWVEPQWACPDSRESTVHHGRYWSNAACNNHG